VSRIYCCDIKLTTTPYKNESVMLIFQYLIIYGRINKEVRIVTCISNTSYMASDDVNLSLLTTVFFGKILLLGMQFLQEQTRGLVGE
jgi:hypothetical protein